jgi:peptide/nickel transport system permease protein
MRILKALAYRLVVIAATVVAGGLLATTLARYAPGFGADEQLLDARLSSDSVQALHDASNEERNVVSYYVGSMGRMLKGDLGTSHSLQRPVRELLAERSGVTLRMVGGGLAAAWAMSALLVLVVWLFGSPSFGMACTLGTGLLLCLPAGAVALLMILMNGPGNVALALVVFPKIYRYLSDLVTATARMPHVITARAKGISQANILLWHVLPVIGREVLALAGVSVALAIGAAIPVEALGGIPGVGQLAWQSALARDLPVLTNVSIAVIAFTVMANSGADLLADERGLTR